MPRIESSQPAALSTLKEIQKLLQGISTNTNNNDANIDRLIEAIKEITDSSAIIPHLRASQSEKSSTPSPCTL